MADVIFVVLVLIGFGAADRDGPRGGAAVIDTVIPIAIAVALIVYLVAALLFPERF